MQLHEIKPTHKRKKIKRVGRGATRGTYSGRGIKGQKARSGRKMRPEMRDIIKKIHKKRGYQFASINEKPVILNIVDLNIFEDGALVSPRTLVEKNLIRKIKKSFPMVKILGNGEIKKKLVVSSCAVSLSAKTKIEKAGGSIT